MQVSQDDRAVLGALAKDAVAGYGWNDESVAWSPSQQSAACLLRATRAGRLTLCNPLEVDAFAPERPIRDLVARDTFEALAAVAVVAGGGREHRRAEKRDEEETDEGEGDEEEASAEL